MLDRSRLAPADCALLYIHHTSAARVQSETAVFLASRLLEHTHGVYHIVRCMTDVG